MAEADTLFVVDALPLFDGLAPRVRLAVAVEVALALKLGVDEAVSLGVPV